MQKTLNNVVKAVQKVSDHDLTRARLVKEADSQIKAAKKEADKCAHKGPLASFHEQVHGVLDGFLSVGDFRARSDYTDDDTELLSDVLKDLKGLAGRYSSGAAKETLRVKRAVLADAKAKANDKKRKAAEAAGDRAAKKAMAKKPAKAPILKFEKPFETTQMDYLREPTAAEVSRVSRDEDIAAQEADLGPGNSVR